VEVKIINYIYDLTSILTEAIFLKWGVLDMRIRKQALGNRNIVGAKIEAKRKELGMKQIDLLTQLQIRGVELTASGLSKLEGQIRSVNDYELVAIADVLGVSINWLVGKE